MGSGLCTVAGCCVCGNQPSGYTKGWNFVISYTTVRFSRSCKLPATSLVRHISYDISCQIARPPGIFFSEVADATNFNILKWPLPEENRGKRKRIAGNPSTTHF